MMCFVDLVPDLVPTWSLKIVRSFNSSQKVKPLFHVYICSLLQVINLEKRPF